jgi:AraC-like DNA-binding protein
MVNNHCKTAVKDDLNKLGIIVGVLDLGEVEIMENISKEQRNQLKIALLKSGYELMDDKRAVLIEKIKNTVIAMVRPSEEVIKMNFSNYLSEKLQHDYTYLANIFSEVEGTTIEQFIIRHKVELIKELITDTELNITKIAWEMGYSSVSHLSNQFKKVTGISPSNFKQIVGEKKNVIEGTGKEFNDTK